MKRATKEVIGMLLVTFSLGPIFNASIIKDAAKTREAIKTAYFQVKAVNRAPAVIPKQ